MKKFLGAVLIICLCMFFGSALYSDDLPDEGMDPGYEPENVTVPDERLNENTVPVDEPEIEEKNDLENDEDREDSNYNAFEGEINEIKADQKETIE